MRTVNKLKVFMGKTGDIVDLGTMHRISDLREVWADEAKNFTPWLAKEANLKMLSAAVEMDLVLEEMESSVGAFSADLFAREESTNRKVIIENQLEATNHDHLGKLITYASGKGADVVIWIVKRARDEHRQAIEWLNQRTDSSLGFFLIEIELWKIDDSKTAAKFNVVEKPNEWAKAAKVNNGVHSATKLLQLDFWAEFKETSSQDSAFMDVFKSLQKEQPQHWYNLRIGSSYCLLELTVNTQKKLISVGFYIRDDKEFYAELKAEQETITQELGVSKMTWKEANKDCRIFYTHKADINNRGEWSAMFAWLREYALKFNDVFRKRIK